MTQIEPYPIWFGNASDGTNWQALFAAEIRAVIYLAAEQPLPAAPRELVVCRFPLLDGRDNPPDLLEFAIHTTAGFVLGQWPALLCCSVGRSRSPAIAAGALALACRVEPSEMLKHMAQAHAVDISPGLWYDVVDAVSRLRESHS